MIKKPYTTYYYPFSPLTYPSELLQDFSRRNKIVLWDFLPSFLVFTAQLKNINDWYRLILPVFVFSCPALFQTSNSRKKKKRVKNSEFQQQVKWKKKFLQPIQKSIVNLSYSSYYFFYHFYTSWVSYSPVFKPVVIKKEWIVGIIWIGWEENMGTYWIEEIYELGYRTARSEGRRYWKLGRVEWMFRNGFSGISQKELKGKLWLFKNSILIKKNRNADYFSISYNPFITL